MWLSLPDLAAAAPAYGLQANIARPPVGAILSVLMAFGLDMIGSSILRRMLPDHRQHRWLRWQVPMLSAAGIAAVLFPLALTGVLHRPVSQALAYLLAMLGFFRLGRLVRMPYREPLLAWFRGSQAADRLAAGLLAGLAMLALGPITEADSLDYHVGVALSILNSGSFPFSPEWFHSRLAGSGEVLISLGLSIGAEQFGSLLQFLGVLAVFGILREIGDRSNPMRSWVLLAMASCPVLLAWAASPKPMLLPGAMTTSAFMIVLTFLFQPPQGQPERIWRNAYALVCLLVMTAATMKMSFVLSGGVVGLVALAILLRRGKAELALSLGVIFALLTMAPYLLWKQAHFGGAVLDGLFIPFPGNWPGTTKFESMLRGYRDSDVFFPVSLIIPESIGKISTVLGAGLLVTAVFVRSQTGQARLLIGGAIAVAIVGAVLGQRNARFFLEPFYWLLMAILLHPVSDERPQRLPEKFILAVVLAQAIAVTAMMAVGIATLVPGAIISSARERVMTRHANGYAEMRWLDTVLPRDAVVISELRSVALLPRNAISNDWSGYVTMGGDEGRVYRLIIAARAPNVTVLQSAPDASAPPTRRCAREVVAGPFVSRQATRNPFNSGSPYAVWALRMDPGCLTALAEPRMK